MSTDARDATAAREPLLEVSDLRVHFRLPRAARRRARRAPDLPEDAAGIPRGDTVKAVDGVDLRVARGETLGLVGESGCGKTTLGSAVMGVRPEARGHVRYRTAEGRLIDAAALAPEEVPLYRREVRMVFQDPYASLNPRMTLLQVVGEPLRVLLGVSGSELEDSVAAILRRVGLRPDHLRRYPHAFSGGERQRVGIARALAPGPRLVVADEAVSALDVSVRSQILNLLQDLQEEMGLTYLFVSHDLSVVEHLCDRVAVMYLGRLVELSPTRALYARPLHPYTEALISAVPVPDPRLRRRRPVGPPGAAGPRARRRERVRLRGDLPDPSSPPPGCPFHTRCRHATARCAAEVPPLREIEPGRLAACHHAEELSLSGAA
ncbi:ABC transporter ATP-binding protein [Streptomonospora nanhaiensis]|uniref:ABC transporter ATP-binding protein n=1 Tax=Streptomonospora nanhaiensis TaxID=1323731 RepID=UPI001C38E1C3|nr:oligopeptide/dipeptide ABC transporter ATP-binding protein [Streptomonospora nanhaiensis]MBV2363347.1 ATP-binding cassette domain-containing protein [Streptomonospora nanhaiensis]